MSQIKLKDETIKIGEALGASGWQNDSYTIEKITNDSKPTSKAGEIPYFHSDYTTAEKMSERMYCDKKYSSYVKSGLLTGTMWDVMINYMSNEIETNKSIANANDENYYKDMKSESTWGNYTNTTLENCKGRYSIGASGNSTKWENNSQGIKELSIDTILTTGSTEEVKKKNIYDVAGNLWEWTQEDVSDQYYMQRGGSFYDTCTKYPACYRARLSASSTDTRNGFRVALYIK